MKKKRDLFLELNIENLTENNDAPFNVDIQKIKSKVNRTIDSAYYERTVNFMKSKKRIALIAAATVCVLGITAFAASGIISIWNSSSSGIPEYKSLPTAEQIMKDIGYEAVTIEKFANGYKFDNGSIVDNALADENGKIAEKFKSVAFRYEKDGDEVLFSQDKYTSDVEKFGEVMATVAGVDVYYHSYTNKFVPSDYKMTEEDIRAKGNGEIEFSYGSEKVQIIEVQSVSWKKNGIHSHLMQMDGKLSADELVEMAQEVIEK